MHAPSFIQRFITGLTHVLAVGPKGCADFRVLERRLMFIASLRTEYGLDPTCWHTIHCVHEANPLTYTSPLHDDGGTAIIADVAVLWREHLHQGLYVPTVGSHGGSDARRALHAFASAPRLVSQVRLTINPTDPAWTETVDTDLVEDLRILYPLWDLPSNLPGTDTTRFHLAVQAEDEDMPDARATVVDLLRATGMGRVRLYSAFNDARCISFQGITPSTPVDASSPAQPDNDVHDSDDPLQTCFGIDTDGTLFSAIPRTETLDAITPLAVSWDSLHSSAIRAGWTA